MSFWLWVRLGLVSAAFLGGLLMTPEPAAVPPIEWAVLPIVLILVPFGLLFVVGVQYANPRSAPVWRYPEWRVNPFKFSEPLQFFHLAAFIGLAQGVGTLIHLAITQTAIFPEALMALAIGVGMLLGVKLCAVAFRKKMGHGI